MIGLSNKNKSRLTLMSAFVSAGSLLRNPPKMNNEQQSCAKALLYSLCITCVALRNFHPGSLMYNHTQYFISTVPIQVNAKLCIRETYTLFYKNKSYKNIKLQMPQS